MQEIKTSALKESQVVLSKRFPPTATWLHIQICTHAKAKFKVLSKEEV